MHKATPEPQPAWTRLSEKLHMLDEAAARAVVPGELDAWSRAVGHVLAAVHDEFERYVVEERERYAQIQREDAALAPRVETLEQDLAELQRELRALSDELYGLRVRSDVSGPASAEPTESGGILRDRVLQWATRVRAYRGRSDSWFVESIYRDRGV